MDLKVTPRMEERLKLLTSLMHRKGVKKDIIEEFRVLLCCDAVTQAEAVMYDRIYSAIALMLRKHLGFGPKRIMECLKAFDETVGRTKTADGDGNTGWTSLMQELKDETGIVISSGDGNRLVCEVSRE